MVLWCTTDAYHRDAVDLARFYGDVDGQIRGLVAPAQDYEALAMVVAGGDADHERRMTDQVIDLVGFESEMRAALHGIGPYWEMVLEQCYREVMATSGTGKGELISRASFGIDRDLPRRAETISNWERTTLVPVRGCGNLAHLVPVLIYAFDHERTRLEIGPWVDRLGLKFQRGQASPDESAWCHKAPQQCTDLRDEGLGRLHR